MTQTGVNREAGADSGGERELCLLPWPASLAVKDKVNAAGLDDGDSKSGGAEISWRGGRDERVAQRIRDLLPREISRRLIVEIASPDTGFPGCDADESYRLQITREEIFLTAATTWGGLHGVTTLWQLGCDAVLPAALTIEDAPRFTWRGVLIDVARHFMPVDLLHRVVDGLARLKMNVLHLHLTDDQGFRFASSAFPKLASDEHYSVVELEALVTYAARLGVRVVPELDVPGHVNCWLEKYPRWGQYEVEPTVRFGVHRACLNVTDEAVNDAVVTLFEELAEVFPDEYLHIGGDEVHPAWWSEGEDVQAYMAQHGLRDVRALQSHFNRRLYERLSAMGRKVVGWDEVLHEDMPPLVIQNWRGATTRDRALSQSLDCIVSAGYYLDLFYPSDIHYGYDPAAPQHVLTDLEDRMREDARLAHIADGLAWTDQWRSGAIELTDDAAGDGMGRILGGEACLWSELVDAGTLEVRLWSRLPAVAERLWSPAEVDDVEDFYRRLARTLPLAGLEVAKLQHERLQALGLDETQIAAAAYLEPVKWYARLLGEQVLQARLRGAEMPQARPYDTQSKFNRIVDFINPESLPARDLIRCTADELQDVCGGWAALRPDTWPEDIQDAVAGLRRAGELMLAGLSADADALSHCREQLQAVYRPRGEYMVAVVPVLLRWLEQR